MKEENEWTELERETAFIIKSEGKLNNEKANEGAKRIVGEFLLERIRKKNGILMPEAKK